MGADLSEDLTRKSTKTRELEGEIRTRPPSSYLGGMGKRKKGNVQTAGQGPSLNALEGFPRHHRQGLLAKPLDDKPASTTVLVTDATNTHHMLKSTTKDGQHLHV
jgi:hypothetical protein